jgi:NitT/TauT family transport system substrate-binding protein
VKRLLGLLMILVIGTTLVGCSTKSDSKADAEPKQLKKFNVGYLPTPGHVLYFVAKEKGYFQQEGLDVELFQFNNSGEGLNAIKSGKLDAGSFGTGPFTFIAKGVDLTMFGGQQTEGAGMIAKPEKADQFKDIKNFKGKSVATVRLATGDVVFRGALTEGGIDWRKDVTIKELDSPAAVLEAVKKGAVDAGIVWTPYIKMAEKQGLKIVMYSGDMLNMHICCRQAALTTRIKENPQDYEKFMTALIKAYKFYQNNHDETIDILAKYVTVDRDILKDETYSGHIFSIPDPDKAGVVAFWNYMNRAGYISSSEKIENHINTDIYKTALDNVLKQEPNDPTYEKLKSQFIQ